ncbi:hypothetical protein [Calothrix sp. CCY 0018]|uniref:hypothetical protein n=1 Tax=Calothrix sp. CCY 0018 TaxID=3103864 RepID=UPI0039C73C08
MSLIFNVPTVNDKLKDFERLFELWQKVEIEATEVIFDFSQCWFLRPNAVAFLGGLIRLIQIRGGNITFRWDTLHKNVRRNLEQNGFMYVFGDDKEPWQGNSIPYREDRYQDKDSLVDYLAEQWLGRDWLHIGQILQSVIVGTTLEIYANAFEHGQTEIGVFSCGQHYPNLSELKLTVVDFGVGIPHNVRNFQQNLNLPADKALEWAFQPGTTTRRGNVTGGIGLESLKRFVQINKGKLEIFSHDGYVIIDKQQETYSNLSAFFGGTLVNITLSCDESYYSLTFEPDDEPLF